MTAEPHRTLVITNDFPPRRGGIESFVFSLCNAMPPDGVVVYTARMPGWESIDSAVPYPVIRDRAGMLLPTRRLGRQVRAAADAHGCDQVMFGAAAPLGLLARGLRRHAGVTFIRALSHGHEVWWATVPVTRQLLRRIGDDVDVLTYVSEFCRQKISKALSESAAARMEPLSPLVDPTRFRPGLDGSTWRRSLDIEPNRPVVLSAARLVRRKGHDTLVRAWPGVLRSEPGAVLVIVGDGPSQGRLARMARRRQLEDCVRFVPAVPWGDMPGLYAMADVFALPCRTRLWGLEPEAFGIAFQEAGASGLPLVVGESGGAREAAQGYPSVVVEDPADPVEVARGICLMLTRRRLGPEARVSS